MPYIILGGSAAFDDYDLLKTTMDAYLNEVDEKFTVIIADQKEQTTLQVTGIGFLGAKYCRYNNIPVLTFTTDNRQRTATILRNTKIAKFVHEEYASQKCIIAAFIFMHGDVELDTDGRTLATALTIRDLADSIHFIPVAALPKDAYTGPHHIETTREQATQDSGQKD